MDALIGLTLEDKYLIKRKLGEGGMGAVYEGERTVIGRRVAIKTLHAQYAHNARVAKRFINEAKAANQIRHPNIIEVFDFGRLPDGGVFLVIELLDGQDLGQLLDRHGPLPLGRAVRICEQVCAALSATHAQDIVHRDLKPDNIFLIEKEGNPEFAKVLDFGISKIREDDELDTLTKTGDTVGTPYFMAPEQLQGSKNATPAADIYALGVVLYNILTDRYPFEGRTLPDLMVKVMTELPRPITDFRTDLPEPVVDLIHAMLQKVAEERPPDCAFVREALLPYRDHLEKPVTIAVARDSESLGYANTAASAPGAPLVATPPTRVGQSAQSPRSNRSWLFGAIGLVALLGAGGYWLSTQDDAAVGEITDNPPEETVPTEVIGAPSTVRIRILSPNPWAELTLDGESIENPTEREYPRSETVHVIVATMADGQVERREEVFDESREIRVGTVATAEVVEEVEPSRVHMRGPSMVEMNAPEATMVEASVMGVAMIEVTMQEEPTGMETATMSTTMTGLTETQNTGTMSIW